MIRFDHITKQYSGTTRPALDDVTFEELRGEFVFLVGASGSGKSTCLRLILKEEKPTRGKLHVLGQDLGTISNRKVPYFRRNIGVVFQDFRLLNNKSVFDNVAFTLRVIGKSKGYIQEAVPDVLNMVGLDGKAQRLPHELSGGEQQRVAIARAVVNKPQVLLADEPTGNLDPATSAGIMAVLEHINASGTTVLMATHEAGIVDQMQRRVIELVDGRIVRDERHGGYGFTAAAPVVGASPPTTLPVPEEAVVARSAADPLSRAVLVDTEAVSADPIAPMKPAAYAEPRPPVERGRKPTSPAKQAAHAEPPADERQESTERHESTERPGSEQAPDSEHEPVTASTRMQRPTPPVAQPVAQSTPDGDQVARERRSVLAARATPAGAQSPAQPTPAAGDGDLPEQLSLAERLGLRAPGASPDDDTHEQNVGPVS